MELMLFSPEKTMQGQNNWNSKQILSYKHTEGLHCGLKVILCQSYSMKNVLPRG